jgi:hypothetical protein
MKGHAIIHNPTHPDSVKRRQFVLDSLAKSGIEWTEEIEENRVVITYAGQPKPPRPPISRKSHIPPPVTLEKCLKQRCGCETDDIEYWDEMIRLSAERERTTVATIAVRDGWKAEQWRDTWAVIVSAQLAVNRCKDSWAVTHTPTGLVAGSAQRLKDAITKAREVSHWPEWAMVQSETDVTPEFRRKATDVFKGVAA